MYSKKQFIQLIENNHKLFDFSMMQELLFQQNLFIDKKTCCFLFKNVQQNEKQKLTLHYVKNNINEWILDNEDRNCYYFYLVLKDNVYLQFLNIQK